uniref:Uncharacterized protein n=1 Tax=Caenorhabditis japonica TaxID=281687 RepID=A0A8R1IJL0_CAEJA
MTSSFRLCVSSQPHAISRDELTAEQDHSSPLIDQRTMNSSSMVGPPMKYPDISVVLRYLPVEKRRDLARKAPFLRTLNKKMPYNFKKIDLTLYHVKKTKWEVRIDSLTWRFEYFKDDTGITIKMCNPEGHSVNLAQNGPVNRICQYYMDRAGTLIDHMSILTPPFPFTVSLLYCYPTSLFSRLWFPQLFSCQSPTSVPLFVLHNDQFHSGYSSKRVILWLSGVNSFAAAVDCIHLFK